ncbi:MAG TPA: 6-carboxyhexanoate--CoA ligase [Nitrospiraceae bacterium]|nr:6-carboxyhexanoate--CoA ligase [Nitrospiraceae bacterium]
MRASAGGRHVSGAERIILPQELDHVMTQMTTRARSRSLQPDHIVVSVERIDGGSIRHMRALDVVMVAVPHALNGRSTAAAVLQQAGVSSIAVEAAVREISRGPSPSGGNMRGAMIMDAATGARLEPDHARGVRASRFDWSPEAAVRIDGLLTTAGLTHFRTREALALATKVAHGPGVVAELCWSDEPEYLAGYVSSLATGYVRISCMKQQGDPSGGRVFFVRSALTDLAELVRFLEKQAVLITETGTVHHYKDNNISCPTTPMQRDSQCAAAVVDLGNRPEKQGSGKIRVKAGPAARG